MIHYPINIQIKDLAVSIMCIANHGDGVGILALIGYEMSDGFGVWGSTLWQTLHRICAVFTSDQQGQLCGG